MSKIYDTIVQTMDELEMHYQLDDEHKIVDLNIQCDAGSYRIRFAAMEEQEVLYCFAIFPLNVPEPKRPAMCELINAINYDGLLGTLTMDPEDGQILCRMNTSVDEGAVNPTIVKVALNTSFRVLEDNYQAILKILAA